MNRSFTQTKEILKGMGRIFWILSCLATFILLIVTGLNVMGIVSLVEYIHPVVSCVALPTIMYVIFDGVKRLIQAIHY